MASIPELTQAPRAKEAPGAGPDRSGIRTALLQTSSCGERAHLDLDTDRWPAIVPRTQGHRLPARSTHADRSA